MKRRYISALFLVSFVLLVISLISAQAAAIPYFTYSLDKPSAARGELVKLQINAGQVPDTAAGFRMRISYNAAALSFVRTETSSQIKSGTMVTNSTANPICSVYVCNVDQGAAPELSGNIISFVFQIRENAVGDTVIGAHIDQVCNYAAKQLDVDIAESLTVSVKPPEEEPSDEAALAGLEPYQGKLVPEFSPDVYQYRMYVNDNVESVEFYARAEEGGSVKINRKSLFKAGTDTPIVATVTSADKQNKAQYMILVSRADKPGAAAAVNSGLPSGEEKTSRPGKTVSTQTEFAGKEPVADAVDGKDGLPGTSDDFTQSQQQAVQTAVPPSVNTANHADRNIYIIGNQMPVYLVGMLTAALCIMIGIALSFYLKIKPKN